MPAAHKSPKLYLRYGFWWVSFKNRRWSTRCRDRSEAERAVARAMPRAEVSSEAQIIIRQLRADDKLRVEVLRAFKPHDTIGTIYFVLAIETNHVKVGYTTDLEQRLEHLRVHNSSTLRTLLTVPGKKHDEHRYHKMWKHLRVRGEWYRYEGDIVAFVAKRGERSSNVMDTISASPAH